MARPSNTDQRRTQIAAALIKVMAKRGYDGASIGDIAKAARLTSGLVHYHFESKQEILLASLESIANSHDARLEERMAKAHGRPLEEVGAFIDFHLGLGADADPEALACWILLSGEALRSPKVRTRFESAMTSTIHRLAESIRRGVELGDFRCEDADAAAAALVATIQGYFVLAASARSAIPKGSAARSTKQMAEGLLKPARAFRTPAKSR
ncbi:MAG: TetR/AcrR family transcriptional regulator [Deltaproteobacteria bacterium]|nr:TetR/AcrR family transcriptional regulator [Deltaproteobacteria bacterium]